MRGARSGHIHGKFLESLGVFFLKYNPEPKALNVLEERRGEPSAIPWL